MIHLELLVCVNHRGNSDIGDADGRTLTAVVEGDGRRVDLDLVRGACCDLHGDARSFLFFSERLAQLELVEVWQVSMDQDEMAFREHEECLVQIRYICLWPMLQFELMAFVDSYFSSSCSCMCLDMVSAK